MCFSCPAVTGWQFFFGREATVEFSAALPTKYSLWFMGTRAALAGTSCSCLRLLRWRSIDILPRNRHGEARGLRSGLCYFLAFLNEGRYSLSVDRGGFCSTIVQMPLEALRRCQTCFSDDEVGGKLPSEVYAPAAAAPHLASLLGSALLGVSAASSRRRHRDTGEVGPKGVRACAAVDRWWYCRCEGITQSAARLDLMVAVLPKRVIVSKLCVSPSVPGRPSTDCELSGSAGGVQHTTMSIFSKFPRQAARELCRGFCPCPCPCPCLNVDRELDFLHRNIQYQMHGEFSPESVPMPCRAV